MKLLLKPSEQTASSTVNYFLHLPLLPHEFRVVVQIWGSSTVYSFPL